MVGRRLAELGDLLAKPADIGRSSLRLTGFQACPQAIEVARVDRPARRKPATAGPVCSARSRLRRRSGLCPISADAAATIRVELRRLTPSVTVRAWGNVRRNRSRLALDAPRKR